MPYSVALVEGGEQYRFLKGEIKEVPDSLRGKHSATLRFIKEGRKERSQDEKKEKKRPAGAEYFNNKRVKEKEKKNKFNLDLQKNFAYSYLEKPLHFLYTFQYENEHFLPALKRFRLSIDSIKNQNVKIIVVNGSKQKIKDQLPKAKNIRYIHKYQKQFGCKGKLINIGVNKYVKTPYFFMSDIDLIYPYNYVENMKTLLNNLKIKYKQEIRVIFHNYNMTTGVYSNDLDFLIQLPCHVGFAHGNGLVHKKSFQKIGGFNENMVGYGPEDSEFNCRISKQNKVIYTREIVTVHLKHKRTNLIQMDKNWTIYNKTRQSLK